MRIEFLFDYLSPYSYLAWHALRPLAAARGALVEPVPVLLAALLAANGTRGPAEVPRKRSYIVHDVARSAAVLGVPIEAPRALPFPPLLPLRVTYAAPPEARAAIASALFDAIWARGGGASSPEEIREALDGVADAGALLARAAEPDVKAALRAATDDALARGAFGVPTMLAGGQMFFGLDSLPHLSRFLDGDARMTIDAELVRRWNAVPEGARRS